MAQMGVYKLHSLARQGKGFNPEVTIEQLRDLHVIQNAYADEVNANSRINGIVYSKDEKATELYLSGKPFKGKIKEEVNISIMTKKELIQFAKDNDFKINQLDDKETILNSIVDQTTTVNE